MNTLIEHWRQIPNYPKYEVSTLGNVRHVKHKRILKGGVPYNGYRQVSISKNGAKNKKTICVHQLVALAFLGPKPIGYEINHKDNDRLNNSLNNLEYIPWRENRVGHPPIKKICPVCKKEFSVPYSQRIGRETCSRKCHSIFHSRTLICSACGKEFKRFIGNINQTKKYPSKGKIVFCSKQCQGRWAGKNYGWGRKNDTPLQHL